MLGNNLTFLSIFNEPNSTFILAISTVILAFATIALAYFTFMLYNETKKMRITQVQPEISIYISPEKQWINLIDLIIKNTGPGIAYNIRFAVSPDFHYGLTKGENLLKDLPLIKNGISYMSPNQEFKFLLLCLTDYKYPDYPKLNISVTYKGSFDEQYTKDYFIDFSIIHNLGSENDDVHEISDSLKEINNNIRNISQKIK
nr:hypothetical protein [uncultured Methanoregula sp.]